MGSLAMPKLQAIAMNILLVTITLLLLFWPSPGICSNILGIVSDSGGNALNGCVVDVRNSTGKVVADGRTDLYGRYCIPAVSPGTYTLVLDPGSNPVQSGNGVVNLQLEGLTVDWTAAKDRLALASATPGVASKAAATCAAGWWTDAAIGATAFAVTGGGIVGGLCGAGTICGGGGGAPPAKKSKTK